MLNYPLLLLVALRKSWFKIKEGVTPFLVILISKSLTWIFAEPGTAPISEYKHHF
jgi:hypothetical protein